MGSNPTAATSFLANAVGELIVEMYLSSPLNVSVEKEMPFSKKVDKDKSMNDKTAN